MVLFLILTSIVYLVARMYLLANGVALNGFFFIASQLPYSLKGGM